MKVKMLCVRLFSIFFVCLAKDKVRNTQNKRGREKMRVRDMKHNFR